MKVQGINLYAANSYAPVDRTKGTSAPVYNHPQIKELSNVYYTSNVNFGRSLKEHKSWGAHVNPTTKDVSFKIFTYPDTKKVVVNVYDSKDEEMETPKAQYTLKNMSGGVFKTSSAIPASEVKPGDRYTYTLYKGNGDSDIVKDPYAMKQETLLGASTIYDHSAYAWQNDKAWAKSTNKISRLANPENGHKKVQEARIYELNPATFTQKGTFKAAKEKLSHVKEMGFNTIHIMPVENTYSFNWGYDGVDKFAPNEVYGGPDKLKELIDHAHKLELNVVMDMVPNHLGPDGAQLSRTGPYIKGPNDFGESFNFEGENSRYVRDYIVNSALNWLDNYKCDGLRLDMTKYMESDYTLANIAAEINHHHPDAFTIAEDGRNDPRVVKPLEPWLAATGAKESEHIDAIHAIDNRNISLSQLGMDSEWAFLFYHTMSKAIYGVNDYDTLAYAAMNSQDKVKYVMSHDEIGNFEGTRLIQKLMSYKLNLDSHVKLDHTDISRLDAYAKQKEKPWEEALKIVVSQKAQLAAQELGQMLQEGKLEKYNADTPEAKKMIQKEVLEPLGITDDHIDYSTIRTAFLQSFAQSKMATAFTYAIPGPKMVFQGDENADLTPFRFFRKFEHKPEEDEARLHIEKGYKAGRSAYEESKMDGIKYSKAGKELMDGHARLMKDLNKLSEENPAITKGRILSENIVKHPISSVFGMHTKDDESSNEIFAVTNFGNYSYPKAGEMPYGITFPQGEWEQIMNTNDTKYGGTGNQNNARTIFTDGSQEVFINLPRYSTVYFKRVEADK